MKMPLDREALLLRTLWIVCLKKCVSTPERIFMARAGWPDWAIVYVGHFLKNLQLAQVFGILFPQWNVTIVGKFRQETIWATFWAIFFVIKCNYKFRQEMTLATFWAICFSSFSGHTRREGFLPKAALTKSTISWTDCFVRGRTSHAWQGTAIHFITTESKQSQMLSWSEASL
jgi:hypothetical protein